MHLYKLAVLTAALALSSAILIPAMAHEAHVHGIGKLDIALDGKTLSLHLDSPLVNLVGFEHAASSAPERQAAKDMAHTLRNAVKLFLTNSAAACTLSTVKLASSTIEPALLGEPASASVAGHDNHDGHADLDADFVFQCAAPAQLQSLDVKLFDAFKGFVRIDVQLVTSKHQAAATLSPASTKLMFP